MRIIVALATVLLVRAAPGLHLSEGYDWKQRSVDDNEVVKQAEVMQLQKRKRRQCNDRGMFREQFAVKELRKLSETGIYETIQLKQIKSAAVADGIFHRNLRLVLDLYSPFLQSNLPAEEYEMIVMQSFADDSWTFTINEFPIMDELAIEEFYIKMVERKRREREEALRKLEMEHIITMEREKLTGVYSRNRLSEMTLDQLWDVYESTTDSQTKTNTIHYMNARGVSPASITSKQQAKSSPHVQSPGPFGAIDKKLATLTARQLHQIVTAPQPQNAYDTTKEYERYRAQQLLDELLKQAASP